jgi:CDP-glucose 4,6-dehydratase
MSVSLVSGSFGFLGSAISARLQELGETVVGIERDNHKKRIDEPYPDIVIRGDIRDYDLIRRVIADYEVESVYHCAAQAIVRTCAQDPYTTYDINVMGTVALLEACRNSGNSVKSIVVSSSDKSYGHALVPYTEETPLNPLYTYETSKACQQLITLSYFHNYGVPAKVVASSNVYGPGDPNLSRIIPNAILNLLKEKPALLFEGVANYIREFVYIDDAVNAFIKVSEKGKSGEVYCCGGTSHLTMLDLLKKICSIMGKDPEKYIKMFQKSIYFKEIEKQYIDSTKLRILGWIPNVTLDDGLARTIDYYNKKGS